MRTNNIHAEKQKSRVARNKSGDRKEEDRETKVCSFFFFFSDEIFGAFDFEFFARQVSPAKSKKGAALIVQNPSTPSLD